MDTDNPVNNEGRVDEVTTPQEEVVETPVVEEETPSNAVVEEEKETE